MSQYMINKFKGKYRLLTHLDLDTNDFPRDSDGAIDDAGVYISCQHGNRIYHYGMSTLIAYIPSLQRGRNIKKALKKEGVEIFNYDESDEEVQFKFNVNDIELVAELLKAKTSGANISPFSTKNLPQDKSVIVPEELIDKYKKISSKVDKKDMLMFKKWNTEFLDNILQKEIRKSTKNKKYDWKDDSKRLKLSRQTKEFIWYKGMFEKYLDFLEKEVDSYYNN